MYEEKQFCVGCVITLNTVNHAKIIYLAAGTNLYAGLCHTHLTNNLNFTHKVKFITFGWLTD